MLVLTRRSKEWLQIGDIRIMVVRIKGHSVRLGIDAPPDVKVMRGELVERKKEGAA